MDYTSPTLADEDVDLLIEWLSHKDLARKGALKLIAKVIEGLKTDRFLLVREVERLEKIIEEAKIDV